MSIRSIPNLLDSRKRQIERRLDKTKLGDCSLPVFRASNIHYDFSRRVQGLAFGGIGALHLLARRIGLIDAIDRGLPLLKTAPRQRPENVKDRIVRERAMKLCGSNGKTSPTGIISRAPARWRIA